LKGLVNNDARKGTEKEIGEVAHQLKESNKNLCRNLKENPNVEGNAQKMKQERAQVQEWLEETRQELAECSFAGLVAKVDAERREQDRLTDVRRKEREVSLLVKKREAELQQTRSDAEREQRVASQEIKTLKEELQKTKTINDIALKFEEKKLRAKEQALLRIHRQQEKALQEELESLKGAQDMENTVHDRAMNFLDKKLDERLKDREQWQQKYDAEKADREVELTMLREKREANSLQLKDLEEKRHQQADEYRLRENQLRNNVLVAKQKRDQEVRMQNAILFLQEEGRLYMQRMLARRAAAKGKKKKGKKKK